ncbi:MAG: Uncharacterized membrane protein, DUF373 family [Candidatus Kentron sp. G]|nr:MAG: Uncharacterized membrane protein, DUF373 family [Candidatus Kentron sp. G]VFN07269.1 MAG: Uncharacterized membrane protein, DUF373 family [Candidatus Kentron sp. G]VFN07994.1 MAG: Uncharacterized membrane protein, DUF373 family [Candidatus Kentron sp. G]
MLEKPADLGHCAPTSHLRVVRWTENFNSLISMMLTFVLIIVIVATLWKLLVLLTTTVNLSITSPEQIHGFEAVFGLLMTLLIAMEFNHSLAASLERKRHVIQVRAILLIALLALARKFIILDSKEMSAETIAALAFSLAAIGWVYLMIRRADCETKPSAFSLLDPH